MWDLFIYAVIYMYAGLAVWVIIEDEHCTISDFWAYVVVLLITLFLWPLFPLLAVAANIATHRSKFQIWRNRRKINAKQK